MKSSASGACTLQVDDEGQSYNLRLSFHRYVADADLSSAPTQLWLTASDWISRAKEVNPVFAIPTMWLNVETERKQLAREAAKVFSSMANAKARFVVIEQPKMHRYARQLLGNPKFCNPPVASCGLSAALPACGASVRQELAYARGKWMDDNWTEGHYSYPGELEPVGLLTCSRDRTDPEVRPKWGSVVQQLNS